MRPPWLAALALCACATAPSPRPDVPPAAEAAPATPPAPAPPTLQELMQRELPALPSQKLSLFGAELQVEAASAPTVTPVGNEATEVVLPLGTKAPVRCFVYAQAPDAGASLASFLDSVKSGSELQVRHVRPQGVFRAGDAPALVADVLYTAEQGGQTAGGQLKLVAVASDASPLVCNHDEVGYLETFERVVTQLAVAMQKASDEEAPRYREVMTVSLGGLPVGFTRTDYGPEREGKTPITTVEAMLVPRSSTEVLATDSNRFYLANPRGHLLLMMSAQAINGELQSEMKAEQRSVGTFRYSGKVAGKALSGTFKVPKGTGLSTPMLERRTAKELLSGKVPERILQGYYPAVKPDGVTPAAFVKDDRPNGITVKLGGLELEATVDESGDMLSAQMPAGPTTMKLERLFVVGALP